jgi:hypothetical protein
VPYPPDARRLCLAEAEALEWSCVADLLRTVLPAERAESTRRLRRRRAPVREQSLVRLGHDDAR